MFSMLGKSQEERRNREYEVSLVETLKDSYEGIEEIRFSNSIIRIFQISYTPHSDNIRKRSRVFYLQEILCICKKETYKTKSGA